MDDPRLILQKCSSLTPAETVHKNPWFTVYNYGGYYTIKYNRAQTTVLPVVDDRGIVMVRAKRPVISDITWELPGGGAKEGETPIEAAARELAEETGIVVRDLTRFEKLSPLSIDPRYPYLPFIFQIHLNLQEYEARKSHDDEIEGVECLEFEEILDKIISNEIYMAFPIAILTRFFLSTEESGLLKDI